MRFRRFFLLSLCAAGLARAAVAPIPAPALPPPPADSEAVVLPTVVVTEQLDREREEIVPDLGATAYNFNQQQIGVMSQGPDAPFNQVLLRAPGVAEDSAVNGDLHVRGEHANLQYRIDDVLLPEGISGFGLELDSRFVDNLHLVTGSLPAQYGFRTAGVVDIETKSGLPDPGGDVSLYGGSFGTVRPSLEIGGAGGGLSAYADASFDHNDLGIENPTPSAKAWHDETDQSKGFVYLSDLLDATSRISFIGSASSSAYQVPDTPGLPAGTAPDGKPWLPGSFDSAALDENQKERNGYGVLAYQKSDGDLNGQISASARSSRVHFEPDPIGDLYFDGVASDVGRDLGSFGLQGDASDGLGTGHTLRVGVLLLDESVRSDTTTTVFPVDGGGDPTGPAFPIADDHRLYGLFAGAYAQDEWRLAPELTLNYGARFDVFDATFDREDQLSPRCNLVFQPGPSTALHAGYARYFTPPPVEDVSGATLAKFDGTSNAAPTDQDDPVKAERSDYFDAGISRTLAPGFQAGVDGYYKRARNQLDDGLFGQSLILSAFNYAEGRVFGVELTGSYARGGLSLYGNLARSQAEGKDWDSAEFLFDSADLAYVRDHWIHLDHDQRLSGSCGASYRWPEGKGGTKVYADAIYGTGLRTDATAPDGTNIPNGGSVPSYVTFNAGLERDLALGRRRMLKFRVDCVNLADKSYELRDGSGVGVNAAQYGMRRGFFGSVGCAF